MAVQRHWLLAAEQRSHTSDPQATACVWGGMGGLQASLKTLEDLATVGFHSLPGNQQLELNSGCPVETGHALSTCPPNTLIPPAWPLVPLGLQATEGSREFEMTPRAALG